MQIEQGKIRRGEILRVLYRDTTQRVGDNVLGQIFIEDTVVDINRHLSYLEGKGLIEITKVNESYSTATVMVKITDKGIDLLERSEPPFAGIVLPEL